MSDNAYAFGSDATNAYLTPKEKLVQFVMDPSNSPLSGPKAVFESSVNRTLAKSHVLTDDEYRFMSKKGAY